MRRAEATSGAKWCSTAPTSACARPVGLAPRPADWPSGRTYPPPFRACVVEEDWRELEFIGEGQGAAFAQAIGVIAGTGKRVELSFLTPP